MTRIGKLYQKLLDRRTLTFAEFERVPAAFGYRFVRQRGSRRIWRNDVLRDSRTILPRARIVTSIG